MKFGRYVDRKVHFTTGSTTTPSVNMHMILNNWVVGNQNDPYYGPFPLNTVYHFDFDVYPFGFCCGTAFERHRCKYICDRNTAALPQRCLFCGIAAKCTFCTHKNAGKRHVCGTVIKK